MKRKITRKLTACLMVLVLTATLFTGCGTGSDRYSIYRMRYERYRDHQSGHSRSRQRDCHERES